MEAETIAPRKLRPEEIQYILSNLPKVLGATKEAPDVARKSIIQKLKEQLRDIVITPLAIDELKATIELRFNTARVNAGEPVGLRAAEAISAPVMQISLNTFHTSGSSKNVGSGISAIKELIDASRNRKNPNMSIHFANKNLTFEEVFAKRSQFVELTVGNLVDDYEIYNRTTFIPPAWSDLYLRVSGKTVPESRWVMRLQLKLDVMFMHRVTINDIIKVLDNESPPTLFCVPSPFKLGQIDIYPIETNIGEKLKEGYTEAIDPDVAGLLFLKFIVAPQFDNIIVKGVKNIKGFFPAEAPVWSMVKKEIKAYSPAYLETLSGKERAEAYRTWVLVYNRFKMIQTGLSPEKLRILCEAVGMRVEKETDNYMYVVMPVTTGELRKPGAYVIARMNENEKYKKEQLEEFQQKVGPTELDRAGTYVYADTNGSNLQEILSMEEIDSSRTVTNDFHETASVLGIKAARNLLVKEFSDVLENSGSYVNPRHITLLVDYMTNRGRINPINYNGLTRQATTTLQKASFEQPLKAFSEASVYGKKENITGGITAAIMTGQMPKIGTGMVTTITDMDKYERFLKEVEEGKRKPIDAKQLEEFNTEIVAAEEEEEEGISAMFGRPPPLPTASVEIKPETPLPPVPPPFRPVPNRPSQLAKIIGKFGPAPGELPDVPVEVVKEESVKTTTVPLSVKLPTVIQEIVAPSKPSTISPPQVQVPEKEPSPQYAEMVLPKLNLGKLVEPEAEEEPMSGFINYNAFMGL